MILDGTKINWYHDRVRAWEKGERIAPITIDMALTTACNLNCEFCYGQLQRNVPHVINESHINSFLQDASTIGVKGVSLVSDGESTISPHFAHTIQYGKSLGLSMAVGSNAYLLKGKLLEAVFPHLTYLRVNISAGEEARYREIMGARDGMFEQVVANIKEMVELKKRGNACTIGMQMVLMPKYEDQIMPLTQLALDLGVDYLIIKHCSDDEQGTLGVDYGAYAKIKGTLERAEACSTNRTLIKVKWSKLNECSEQGAIRSYKRCYGAPFLLQISGTGLVAPCGMFFNSKYSRYHMGNITEKSFREIWESDDYWEIIESLRSERFNAQKDCGCLCLQHSVNKYLDAYIKGEIELIEPEGEPPMHKEFI